LTHPYDSYLDLPPKFPGLDNLTTNKVYLLGCKDFEQFLSTLWGIVDPKNHCAFCQVAAGKEVPVFSMDDWYLRKNNYPQSDLRMMLLIIPKQHITIRPTRWVASEWEQVLEIFDFACKEYNLPGGILALRWGDPRYHAGTVPHLHFNIFSPNPEVAYRMPASKNLAERVDNYIRLQKHVREFNEWGGFERLLSES
jgi:diadenosine tetraphosphate (Ap4A) HIT family hydrolase